VLYLERGGRTALVFTDDDEALAAAATALAEALRRARGARFRVESVNGGGVHGSVLDAPLRAAGFRETPQGLRFEAKG
jgi:ATP-dependent Lhr-like helicase